jgi:Tfp pilus assembly protein PilF
MLDVEIFGLAPGPHHLVNVALHAGNAVLLLVVLWRMTGSIGRSTFVAALFAAHPLHVESVAWVAERKDVLSTMGWLLTMRAYERYVRRPGMRRYATVVICLTLGLLAKPVLATLPFALLLVDAWPLGRAPLSWRERRRWVPLVTEKLPLLVPAIAAMTWTLAAQRGIGAVAHVNALPWSLRLANAVMSYVSYIEKMFWPAGLAVFYPYPSSIPPGAVALDTALLIALTVVFCRLVRAHPYLLVGWLWYLGTLLPMIGILQVGSHARADRFTYVPLIGLFIILAWGGADVVTRWVRRRDVAVGLAAVVVAGCAVAARAQVGTWRDSETLWTHALAVTTDNARASAGIAEVLAGRGEIDAAIAHYQNAVRLAPDAADWQVNLGLLLVRQGQVRRALAAFTQAVRLRPEDAEARNNLGAMLARDGRVDEAISEYRRALDLRPGYALARRNLGLALVAHGDLAAGLQACLEALRQAPNEAQWHYEVAVMFLSRGQVPIAIEHFAQTLRLDPTHQAARDALAKLSK